MRCCEYLLGLKMDVNQQDHEGRSSLAYAAEGGHMDTAVALLRCGASLGMVDDKQQSVYSVSEQEVKEWKGGKASIGL